MTQPETFIETLPVEGRSWRERLNGSLQEFRADFREARRIGTDYQALAKVVEKRPAVPLIFVSLNRFWDRARPPTTTPDTLSQTWQMFNILASDKTKTPEQRNTFQTGAEYFALCQKLLKDDTRPGETYEELMNFWEEKGLFDSASVSTHEFVSDSFAQAGVEPKPGEIEAIIAQYGKTLHHPYLNRIFPAKVEIMDQDVNAFPESLKVVNADYHDIKGRLIALPLPTKLRPSLLLRDYQAEVGRMINKIEAQITAGNETQSRKVVVKLFGAGKGEEAYPFTKNGQAGQRCVVSLTDVQPTPAVLAMVQETFHEIYSRHPEAMPYLVSADEMPFEIFVDHYARQRKNNPKGAIYVEGDVNLDTDRITMPDNNVDITACCYGAHHAQNLPAWLAEAFRITRPLQNGSKEKAVIFVDARPTQEHFAAQFESIIALSDKLTTGWDGAVTHSRAYPVEAWPSICQRAPGSWHIEELGPNLEKAPGFIRRLPPVPGQIMVTAYSRKNK